MTTSPRAALFAAPTLIALAGAALIARHAQWSSSASSNGLDRIEKDYVIDPSVVDDDSGRIAYEKQIVAMELLRGNCTVAQAADRFRPLLKSSSEKSANMLSIWHARTEWECAVRQAVAFARSLSRSAPTASSRRWWKSTLMPRCYWSPINHCNDFPRGNDCSFVGQRGHSRNEIDPFVMIASAYHCIS